MSVEKTADESPDDDTDWLYGDDNFAEEETTEKEVFSALIGDVDGVNGINYQESESDSDDDDVCVTIGAIKTGGSQSLSLGSSSISLNIKTSVSGCESRALEVDAEGRVLEADGDTFEEKPWRKPGADLSDYFNYGFNEDTWKTYCDKHRRLRMSLEILSLGSSNKIMVHSNSSDPSEYSSILSRKQSGTIDVIGGQTGTISRVEGRRRHSADENNIQIVSEQSSDTELPSPKLLPFFPPNIPPPPFPPPSISTAPTLIPPPPPGFSLPPGAPPLMIPSGHLAGVYDGRSAPLFPFPPGLYPPTVGMTSWPGAIDSSKPWEYYSHYHKERESGKTREKGHKKEREKDRERYRETDRDHSSPLQDHRSEEERPSRHRDHSHYGRERYRDSSGREGEDDRRRDRRHRDRSERHRSSYSSRRHHDSGDADSHRRHRHKRSRHNHESREPSEERSMNQENQSEATE